jgi:hypothetical protein
VVQQNGIPIATLKKSEIAVAKVRDFKDKARNEVQLVECSNLDEQLKFAYKEALEYSCACFKDYWVDQDSGLLDTAFSSGKLELIIIRRGYTQGWWALALRELGKLLRAKDVGRTFGGSEERGMWEGL